MILKVRRPAVRIAALVSSLLMVLSPVNGNPEKQIKVAATRRLALEGENSILITEQVTFGARSYSCSYSFRIAVHRGLGVSGDLRDYVCSVKNVQHETSRTTRIPLAGYVFFFFANDRPFVDIEFVEKDIYPQRMSINGVHPIEIVR
jgi:hypothetical protein